jgi:hypothetical protein
VSTSDSYESVPILTQAVTLAPAQEPAGSRIHLIGGEKGGVGKSVLSRLLAQYFIDHNLAFTGFDTDRSHGALMRFYKDYASPVLVDRFEALDAIVESAIEQPGQRVLVDLAAQTHDPLVRWMDESGVLELAAESGVQIHYWHVMDAGRDSVDLLERLIDRFEDRLQYVLVLNELRGDDFGNLEPPALGPVRARQGPGRARGAAAPPAGRRAAQDRRHRHQLLGRPHDGQQRRPEAGPAGAPAAEDVAGARVQRDRRGRRLKWTTPAGARHRRALRQAESPEGGLRKGRFSLRTSGARPGRIPSASDRQPWSGR